MQTSYPTYVITLSDIVVEPNNSKKTGHWPFSIEEFLILSSLTVVTLLVTYWFLGRYIVNFNYYLFPGDYYGIFNNSQ